MKKLLFLLILFIPSLSFAQWTTSGTNIYNTNLEYFVGIGTSTPSATLHVGSLSGSGIRLGRIGDGGNTAIPIGAQAAQYNLDFSGYRDIVPDQIGARISAIRFNNYGNNIAFVQTTGLAFYTNPSGYNAGTTDLTERMRITPSGNVGIGTITPDYKLTINGKIKAEEVQVVVDVPVDYVFEKNYPLMPLTEVEKFIAKNKYLPEVPDAQSVITNGWQVGEMNNKLLEKVEELTLYIIEQNKRIEILEKKLKK